MKKETFAQKTHEELANAIAKNREALRALRFRVHGRQDANVRQIRALRKTIARLETARNAHRRSAALAHAS